VSALVDLVTFDLETGAHYNATLNDVYAVHNVDKNLAIANRSRVSCINTNNNTMTLKSGLEVTQGH